MSPVIIINNSKDNANKDEQIDDEIDDEKKRKSTIMLICRKTEK